MATNPMPQAADSGASPDQGGGSSVAASTQQANSLQASLGKLMQIALTLGQQNTIIQPEMAQIATQLRQAFVKVTQGSQPAPQPASPPGQ